MWTNQIIRDGKLKKVTNGARGRNEKMGKALEETYCVKPEFDHRSSIEVIHLSGPGTKTSAPSLLITLNLEKDRCQFK